MSSGRRGQPRRGRSPASRSFCFAALGLAAWLPAACGSARTPLPSSPEPIAYVDTLPVSEPEFREPPGPLRPADIPMIGGVGEVLSIRRWTGPDREAMNVTRFDDVVGSAWFERRNGYRRLTPEEVARGPTTVGPDTSRALRIVGMPAGRTPGFFVEDARGDRYLFKFDPPGFRHLATAADVISSRLLYAAGYHTPENYIVTFDGARLVLDPTARASTGAEGGRPMHPGDVEAVLSRVDPLPDGRLLAMASKVLPGVAIGPFRFEGRRRDDPNDYYHHQYRRELRGLYVLAAWINHVELHSSNTLDTYVEPGYVRHHLIDFGETLGSGTVRPLEPRTSRRSGLDLVPMLARFFTLGFHRPAWATLDDEIIHPSVGWLRVGDYRPDKWAPRFGSAAFSRVTARDGYWGAKLVAAFSDAQIRAAVAEGGFSDPFAADTLAEILAFRRDRTVAYWYARVAPIEEVRIEGAARRGSELVVSFLDLGIRDGVRAEAATRYRYRFEDRARDLSWRGESPAVPGTVRQTVVVKGDLAGGDDSSGGEGVATLDVWVLRNHRLGRPARVYLAREPRAATYRVVGLVH